MMACFSVGVPPTAVYLVKPLLMAAMAASLMCCGVSKSGSPVPRPMMSLPSAFSLAARAATARVGEGLMACTRFERVTINPWVLNLGRIILETVVERSVVCVHRGVGQGATTRTGHSIPRRSNAAMRREGRAIRFVATHPLVERDQIK